MKCGLLAISVASAGISPASRPPSPVAESATPLIEPPTNSVATGAVAGRAPWRPLGVTRPAKNVWMSPVRNVSLLIPRSPARGSRARSARVAVPLVRVDRVAGRASSAMTITWLPTTFHVAGEAARPRPATPSGPRRAACGRAPSAVGARGEELVAARLVVAVLALVEQEQLGVGAEPGAVDAVGVARAQRGMCSKNAL